MVNEKVTFVIPAYIKSKEYLYFFEQTLKGLKEQTIDSWQAIVIEDCSPERDVVNVINMYQKEDNRIHAIYLDERKTTGECRNIGIQWAVKLGSPIILFNDADDISHRKRVEWVTNIFRENESVSVVYSNIEVIDENRKPVLQEKLSPAIKRIISELNNQPPIGTNCWYKIGVLSGYVNVTSSTAVRTKLAAQELFPNEYISEDMHTWLRYGACGEFYFDKNCHCQYRVPSFVQRQSSNDYVRDFNANKVRVDCDGFSKALELAAQKQNFTENSKRIIMLRFYMKLMQEMEKEGRQDLVFHLIERCNLTIDNFENEECIELG